MEKFVKKFTICPACGAEDRGFFAFLTKELKELKLCRAEFEMFLDLRTGAVKDPATEKQIPVGTEVPSYVLRTDICMECGCVYATLIEASTAKKSVIPKIVGPGGQPMRPGQIPPGLFNDPRFS